MTTSAAGPRRERVGSHTRASIALWFGLLGGPAAAFLNVLFGYQIVNRACIARSSIVIHLFMGAFVVLALIAGAISWRFRARAGNAPDDAGGVLARSRFMATVGLLTAAISVVAILMQWIPVFFIGACQGS
jgi:small-conductance mechanosensitive channel